MKKENPLKVIVIALLCPILYNVLQILVSFVYQLIYGVTHAAERQADFDAFVEQAQAAVAENVAYITLVSIVLFFAIIFIFFKVRHKNLLEHVGWNPVPFPVYGLVAIAAVTSWLSVSVLTFAVMPGNLLEEEMNYGEMVTSTSGGVLGFLVMILFTVLLGPIAEEFVFRGFMMSRLQTRFPAWFAVALPTLAFSAMHYLGGIAQLFGTAWTGVFFCLVFLWTKNLRISILSHIVNNAVAVLMPAALTNALFFETSLPVKLIIFIASLAVTVFVLRLIYKRTYKKRDNVVTLGVDTE